MNSRNTIILIISLLILRTLSQVPITIKTASTNLDQAQLSNNSLSNSVQNEYSYSPLISVEVNPNIELLSVVLSYTSWFNQFGLSSNINYSYRDEILTWFDHAQNHLVIEQAQTLTEFGFSYDAPPNFILHFNPPPELEQIHPYSSYILKRGVEKEQLDTFIDKFRDFCMVANFTGFYTEHQSFYNKIITNQTKSQNWTESVVILENFFGISQASYSIIFSPFLFPGGGYGAIIENSNGNHLYAIIRTFSIQNDLPDFGNPLNTKYLVLHEFAHGLVNPIVDNHTDEFDKYHELYLPVATNMSQMGYISWIPMLYETLIRAFTTWVIFNELGEETASNFLALEESRGFYFIDDIYQIYLEYMNNRDKYQDFEAFIPEILDLLDQIQKGSSKNNNSISFFFIEGFLLISVSMLLLKRKPKG